MAHLNLLMLRSHSFNEIVICSISISSISISLTRGPANLARDVGRYLVMDLNSGCYGSSVVASVFDRPQRDLTELFFMLNCTTHSDQLDTNPLVNK
jgi:hypothetical protein